MGITAFHFSSVIDVPTARILGRDDAGTGSAEALTNTEVFAILATGTPSASTYLRGDGTWSTVSAGVGGSTGSVRLRRMSVRLSLHWGTAVLVLQRMRGILHQRISPILTCSRLACST